MRNSRLTSARAISAWRMPETSRAKRRAELLHGLRRIGQARRLPCRPAQERRKQVCLPPPGPLAVLPGREASGSPGGERRWACQWHDERFPVRLASAPAEGRNHRGPSRPAARVAGGRLIASEIAELWSACVAPGKPLRRRVPTDRSPARVPANRDPTQIPDWHRGSVHDARRGLGRERIVIERIAERVGPRVATGADRSRTAGPPRPPGPRSRTRPRSDRSPSSSVRGAPARAARSSRLRKVPLVLVSGELPGAVAEGDDAVPLRQMLRRDRAAPSHCRDRGRSRTRRRSPRRVSGGTVVGASQHGQRKRHRPSQPISTVGRPADHRAAMRRHVAHARGRHGRRPAR